jgi:hypothetical protein
MAKMSKEQYGQLNASEKETFERRFFNDSYEFLQSYVPFDGSRVFVAGGFFTRFFHGLPVRDIDVFINDDAAYFEVRDQILGVGGRIQNEFFVRGKDRPRFSKLKAFDGTAIDLICFHEPRNARGCIDLFDFEHCRLAVDGEGPWFSSMSFDSLVRKEIVVNTNMRLNRNFVENNPLTRMKKYLDLGFTIDNTQLTILYNTILDGKSVDCVDYV